MNRRGFFGAMAGAAIAGPEAAKEYVFSPAARRAIPGDFASLIGKGYGGGYAGKPVDLATIGLRVDSSAVSAASRKLDMFAKAAARCKPLDFMLKHDAQFETGRPDIDCLRSVSPVNKARMARR